MPLDQSVQIVVLLFADAIDDLQDTQLTCITR